MSKRKVLPVLAVSAAASAVLGGVPAAVIAVAAGAAGASTGPAVGSLPPTLAAQLSRNVDRPVIVVLKNQFGQATAGTPAASARAAAVSASQSALLTEFSDVHATGIIPASALGPAASPAATATTTVHHITPGAPARTTSASANSKAATARSLGSTGAGVKVAFIADDVDPDNINFIAKNGKSVFVDYQDFTGNGVGAPTDGGEAFLDANTIAGQGTHIYNLNGFAQQGYPNSCDVKIEGVAPGASLVGLDIFSGDPSHAYVTTNSVIAEAINYAVEHDHVNVVNESFGDNEFPDTTQDVIKLFDNAAIKAGTVVAASGGDSGTMSTIGSPATGPAVISVGASTQFQMYAQSNYGLARYFSTGWLDDNTSGPSSDPQGIGNYGNADVRTPAAGTWTAIDNDVTGADGGFTGAVSWQAVTERFTAFGTVTPSTTTIAPGASTTVTYTATTPAAPGDYAAALELSSNLGGPTSIPVVLRSLVNPDAGGTFAGVLTGGNGRPGNVGQDNYYSFAVPPLHGRGQRPLSLANDPLGGTGGVSIGAYLVSPDGNVVGSGQNYDMTEDDSGTTGQAGRDVVEVELAADDGADRALRRDRHVDGDRGARLELRRPTPT
jgi:hypothetical protein